MSWLLLGLTMAVADVPRRPLEIVMGPTVRVESVAPTTSLPHAAVSGAWHFEQLLPVRTPALRPGKAVGKLRLARPIQTSICVLGADPLSVSWVAAHAAALVSSATACWVVNVEDLREWRRLRRAARDAAGAEVLLMPMSGAVLAELGLRHTPALIHPDGRVEGISP